MHGPQLPFRPVGRTYHTSVIAGRREYIRLRSLPGDAPPNPHRAARTRTTQSQEQQRAAYPHDQALHGAGTTLNEHPAMLQRGQEAIETVMSELRSLAARGQTGGGGCSKPSRSCERALKTRAKSSCAPLLTRQYRKGAAAGTSKREDSTRSRRAQSTAPRWARAPGRELGARCGTWCAYLPALRGGTYASGRISKEKGGRNGERLLLNECCLLGRWEGCFL
jgi:hypothetical protein